jgi:hypothetical protein
MSDDEHTRARPTPSLVPWAFAYPNDPVAASVIARLPAGQVPRLRELFEEERRSHAEAASELSTLLRGG